MGRKLNLGSSDWNLWPITRDYDRLFEILRSQGIGQVELGIYQPSVELSLEKQNLILSAAERNEIKVTALLFSLLPEYWPSGAFSKTGSDFLSETSTLLESAKSMNIRYANIWTGVDRENCDTTEVELTLIALDEMAKGYEGVVSIEYKAETIFSSAEVLSRFLSSTKHLRVLIDTGHAFALEEDVVALVDSLHDKGLLGAMHLGDALAGDSDADLPCGRIHDFEPILRKLQEVGFEHTLNFDLYGAAIDELGPGPVSILAESNAYIIQLLANIGR